MLSNINNNYLWIILFALASINSEKDTSYRREVNSMTDNQSTGKASGTCCGPDFKILHGRREEMFKVQKVKPDSD